MNVWFTRAWSIYDDTPKINDIINMNTWKQSLKVYSTIILLLKSEFEWNKISINALLKHKCKKSHMLWGESYYDII